MTDISRASTALQEENLDAWLFYNYHHRDPVADRVLSVPRQAFNTRPWIYLLRRDGSAVKLLHSIEARNLDHLPGEQKVFTSREQFVEKLRTLSAGLRRTACQFSTELPQLSFIDHGQARLLESCGFHLVSSAPLIQRFLGVLSAEGVESHRRAAGALYAIVEEVWQRLRREMRGEASLWESTVQGWILSLFEERGLHTDSAPIVAAGPHSADPHYSPDSSESKGGAVLRRGDVLQLDLWAKDKAPGSIYADISWVGVLESRAPAEVQRAFQAVLQARELAVRIIGDALQAGESPTGEQVDRQVRAFLQEAGYGGSLRHRTGHGIDEEVHGFGVNLDSVEFPDHRRLLEGSCFSVEPGVYLADFGLRSEINVYISAGRPVISGGKPQTELLVF